MRRIVLALLLATTTLSGCVGAPLDLAPASSGGEDATDPTGNITTSSFNTTPARTVREDCYGLDGVPCFEPSVAADPDGRIFAAVSVCQAIMRSTDGSASFEALELPELPPTAPPTTKVPGDCTLQIGPGGSLYFSAFYFQERPADPPGVWVPNHQGIQVARSDDGGESWSVNTWVGKTSPNPSPGLHPDRQWLSFGDGERVYLTFWDPYHVGRSWVAVSEDAGASFGPFQPMPGYIPGDPVAQGNGTLHAPYLDGSGDGYSVHLATTTDAGESFDTTLVHDAASGDRVWWPDLAQAPDGRLHMTWTDGDRVLVARQTSDGGWSTPLTWNHGFANATPAAPGIEIHDGLLDIVWYRQDGNAQSLVLGRAPLDSWNTSLVETHVLATYNASKPTTHFADIAVTPEGQGMFAWTDPERGMRLLVEDRGNGTGPGVGT